MRTFLILLLSLWLGTPANGITLLSTSGTHFTDTAGNAVFLSGEHTWQNVQDFATLGTFDWAGYLALLKANNHNCVRLWQMDQFDLAYNSPAWGTNQFFPWQRTGPGNALDGLLKFDLSLLSQPYFDRLNSRVSDLETNEIYAMVSLFDVFWLHNNGSQNQWGTNHNNPLNNINGYSMTSNQVFTTNVPIWSGLMEAYIRKTVSTLAKHKNVIYEIANEAPAQSTNFQKWAMGIIKNEESTNSPYLHLVGLSALDNTAATASLVDANNSQLAASPDFFIPNASAGNYTSNPDIVTGSIPWLFDTDHHSTWPSPDPLIAYKYPLRGYSGVLQMSPWASGLNGYTTNVDFRQRIGHISGLIQKYDIKSLVASTTVADSTYALTNTIGQYLFYKATTGTINVNVPSGVYYYRWWDPVAKLYRATSEYKITTQPQAMGAPAGLTADEVLLMFSINRTGGVLFDGVDDVVDCGSAASLDNLTSFTYSAWVRPNSTGEGGFGRILGKETVSDGPIGWGIGNRSGVADKMLFLEVQWSGGVGIWHTADQSMGALNGWLHVAVTYNGSSSGNTPIFYLNGAAIATTTWFTPSGSRTSDAAANLRIGNCQDGSRTFDGYILDARIYPSVLTAAQIAAIYSSKNLNNRFPITIVGQWRMNDGAGGTTSNGATVKDFSGSGNNGTASWGGNASGALWQYNTVLTED